MGLLKCGNDRIRVRTFRENFDQFKLQIFHHNSLTTLQSEQSLALAIGMFDGIHLGHQTMLKCLKNRSLKEGLTPAVWSFTSLKHKSQHFRIIDEVKRVEGLKNNDVEVLHKVDFIPEISQLSAQDFLEEVLIKRLKVKMVMLGANAKLGKDRHCSALEFKEMAKREEVNVELADLYKVGSQTVSSSAIRTAIQEGDFNSANEMLGYEWSFQGAVKDGQKKGRTLGFPTANINVGDLITPPKGVYACVLNCADANLSKVKAILNIGNRPTFNNDDDIVIEAHIPNWSGDLYRKNVHIEKLKYIREEKKFNSAEELVQQIEKDIFFLKQS